MVSTLELSYQFAIYIYISFVLMSIARKTGVGPVWLSWIPIVNFTLLSKVAKMHWWPILLFPVLLIPVLLGNFLVLTLGLGTLGVMIIGIISLLLLLTAVLFILTWWQKTFVALGMSKWWVLALFVPILASAPMGIAAWGGEKVIQPVQNVEAIKPVQNEKVPQEISKE